MTLLRTLLAGATLWAAACSSTNDVESEVAGLRRQISSSGREAITIAPTPSPVPLNEPFELTVRVRDAESGEACAEAEVFVRAWMPDHGHGMFRQPEVELIADGHFRVKGLLFHMGGHWELSVDVVRDGIASAATFDVRL